MDERDWLVERFEANRAHVRSVAYRMLGSASEADDAVQECWLRLSRIDTGSVENLSGWMTTVVSRVCLDMLRSRQSRREQPLDPQVMTGPAEGGATGVGSDVDPEHEALLADSLGPALMVVLETLAPAERLAFVLHDMFAVPFDEIAPIVGRSPEASRQLASRARRRVQRKPAVTDADLSRQREIVSAFCRRPRGRLRSPGGRARPPTWCSGPTRPRCGQERRRRSAGPRRWRRRSRGRARAAQPVLVDGVAGLVWAFGGRPKVVFDFTIADGRIVEIHLLAEEEELARLDLVLLDG